MGDWTYLVTKDFNDVGIILSGKKNPWVNQKLDTNHQLKKTLNNVYLTS